MTKTYRTFENLEKAIPYICWSENRSLDWEIRNIEEALTVDDCEIELGMDYWPAEELVACSV